MPKGVPGILKRAVARSGKRPFDGLWVIWLTALRRTLSHMAHGPSTDFWTYSSRPFVASGQSLFWRGVPSGQKIVLVPRHRGTVQSLFPQTYPMTVQSPFPQTYSRAVQSLFPFNPANPTSLPCGRSPLARSHRGLHPHLLPSTP